MTRGKHVLSGFRVFNTHISCGFGIEFIAWDDFIFHGSGAGPILARLMTCSRSNKEYPQPARFFDGYIIVKGFITSILEGVGNCNCENK